MPTGTIHQTIQRRRALPAYVPLSQIATMADQGADKTSHGCALRRAQNAGRRIQGLNPRQDQLWSWLPLIHLPLLRTQRMITSISTKETSP